MRAAAVVHGLQQTALGQKLCCEYLPQWSMRGRKWGLHSQWLWGLFLLSCSPQIPWTPGRDMWWHELMSGASTDCEPEWCDSEDKLFILYTSGSTGKPKVCFFPAHPQSWLAVTSRKWPGHAGRPQ